MYSNVIVDITISRRSFAFSKSYVKVSVSFTDVGSLVVGAFDLVTCSLTVVVLVHNFDVGH